MSNFICASNSANTARQLYGFSFSPGTAGPNGSGSPGAATTVYLTSVIVGCGTQAQQGQGPFCYVHSAPVDDESEIDSGPTLVGQSAHSTNSSAFGNNSYSSTYSFSSLPLSPSAT